MNNDKDREEEQLNLEVDDDQSWEPRERLFDDFDDSDESDDDRDTDHNAMFSDIDADDDLEESVDEDEPAYFDDSPEDHAEPTETVTWDDQEPQETDPWGAPVDTPYEEDSPEDAPVPQTDPMPAMAAPAGDETDWDEDDQEDDGQDYYEDEDREITLPLGLILVGLVALLLLGAGGYGVMQQRAEMQEEVRRLQSNLATAANPSEVAETRASNEALVELNADLEAELELLTAENRSLQAIVSGLESQLAAQQDALVKPKPAPPSPAPAAAAKPAPKPVARSTAPAPKPSSAAPATVESGSWFVNFGSYSQEETAQGWAERLKPGAGEVVVITGEKSGRTFYRVRVVNLTSREQADATARRLESRYELPKLWVGQSG
ncbi:SPOR domain-containing protein [Halioglobus maricola]|nr:SPOR domain-containing protein [Halioglobus maricola]